jgi:chromosome segregation ATPase
MGAGKRVRLKGPHPRTPAAAAQISREREVAAADDAARLRARVASLEAELDGARGAAGEHGHAAESALRDAEALADALAERGRQLESAERRAGSLSTHAAGLAAQVNAVDALVAHRDCQPPLLGFSFQ